MDEEYFRRVLADESRGALELPASIREPDLLLRSLVVRYLGDRRENEALLRKAEHIASQKTLQAEACKKGVDEAEKDQRMMCSDLAAHRRKVGAFEAKIAFLGKHWEELTGEVNDMISSDPNTAARQAKGEMAAVKTELYDVQLQMRIQSKKFTALQEQCVEQEAAIERWSADVISTSAENSELAATNVALTSRLNETAATLKKTEHKLQQEQAQSAAQSSVLGETSAQLKTSTSKADALASKFSKANRTIADRDTNLSQIRGVVEKNAVDCQEVEDSLRDTKAELAKTKQALAKSEKLLHAEREKGTHLDDILRRKSEAFTNLEAQLKATKETATGLSKELSSTERKAKDGQATIDEVGKGLTQTREELAEIGTQLRASEAKASDLESQVRSWTGKHNALDTRANELDGMLKASQRQYATAAGESRERQLRIIGLERDLKEAKGHFRSSEDRAKQMGTSIERSGAELEGARVELDGTHKDIRGLEDALRGVRCELATSQDAAATFEVSCQKLQAELKETRKELQSSRGEVVALAKEVKRGHSRIESYKSDVVALTSSVDDLCPSLKDADARFKEADASASRLNAELASVRAALAVSEASAADFKASAERSAAHFAAAQKECAGEAQAVLQLRRGVVAVQREVEVKSDDVTCWQGKYEALAADFHDRAEKLVVSERIAEELTIEVERLKKQVAHVEELAVGRQLAATRFEEELSDVQVDLETEGVKGRKLARVIVKREDSIQGLHKEITCQKESVSRLSEEIVATEAEKRQLEVKAAAAEERTKAMRKAKEEVERVSEEKERVSTRIVCELEAAHLKQRETEVVIRKVSADLRHTKQRLQDTEAEKSVLSNNVNRLMEEFKKAAGPSFGAPRVAR